MPAISFDLNLIDWNLTLIVGRAVFLVFCFAIATSAFSRWQRANTRNANQFATQSEKTAQRLLDIDAHIEATQAILTELSERIAVLKTSAGSGGVSPSYQLAIRLARNGAAREDLMASCGLTRQEAELVQRLHAQVQHPQVA